MSIILGYTRQSNDEKVVIGTFDDVASAKAAKESQTFTDVADYWLTSFINEETNEPSILAFIDV